jgi:hypothetical protein
MAEPELIPIMQNVQPTRFTLRTFKKDGIQLDPHIETANQRTVHRAGFYRTPELERFDKRGHNAI